MFQDFEPFTVKTQSEPEEVSIFGLKSCNATNSALPPLLLLHGFPQSHKIWHRVVQRLDGKYNIIAMDLRGYGDSSKPQSVAAYAKSAMARDCVAVMDALGYTGSFFICAHDRGARVAHKLCVDHPCRVRKAIFLDICPTLAMYSKTDFEFAKSYFHWFFLIQKEPLPETLITSSPQRFAEMFMGDRQTEGLTIFEPAYFDAYAKSLGDPATAHSMCQDYRASATLDLDEAKTDLANGRLIQCPLKVFWGSRGVIEKCFDALKEWQAVTSKSVEVGGSSVDSGHYIPEHVPDFIASEISDFLS